MNRCLSLAAAALYVFLYAPIAIVVVYSFNAARFGAAWTGFTTKWYGALLDNSQALSAARNTILLAIFSTAIATVLGTLLGYGLSRFDFPGKRFFSRLLYVPVFIPDIVMAVALLLFYSLVRSWLGLFELGMTTMVLAHVTFQIPSSPSSSAPAWSALIPPSKKPRATSAPTSGRPSRT
jgi:spermidine/putrescine transport system permease protein